MDDKFLNLSMSYGWINRLCSLLKKGQNHNMKIMSYYTEEQNSLISDSYTGIQVKSTESSTSDTDVPHLTTSSSDSPFEDPQITVPVDVIGNVKYDDIVKTTSIRKYEKGYVVGISMRGKSHIKDNLPCQDNHWFETVADGWDLYIVSDGAGSAKYSERGSIANCKLLSKLIRQLLEKNNWVNDGIFPSELEWYIEMRSIFETMRLFYKSKVEELSDGSEIKDFNATALVVLVTPNGLLSAHIGDGRMGYKDDENNWYAIMTPHKGEEANQTLFVTSNWEKLSTPSYKIGGLFIPEVRTIRKKPQVVVLMSDGCEKATWECTMYNEDIGKYADKNTPFAGFLNPLVQALDESDSEENRLMTLQEIISSGTEACVREQDDKTFLMGRY